MDNQGYPEQRYVVTALLRYIFAGILFIALVALFAWFFFFRNTDTSSDTPVATNTTQSDQGSKDTSAESEAATNDQSSTNDEDNDTATSGRTDAEGDSSTTADEQAADTSASSELANTGPGDVLAIFTATVILATILRRYHLAKTTK